MYVAS
jgi:hypothetical protein